ncbi:MAG: helix-turn-helix transcriptional regulator [Clostridia bacterium]
MIKNALPTGMGYFDIDLVVPFNNFDIHVTALLDECIYESVNVIKERFLHILYFQEGNIDISFDGQLYHIEPKTFVIYSSNLEHSEIPLNRSAAKFHILYGIQPHKRKNNYKHLNKFQDESELISKILSKDYYFEIIRDTSENTNLIFKEIIRELDSNFVLQNYSFYSLLLQIIVNCARSYYINKAQPNGINYTSSFYQSNKINSHLELNSKTVTLKELSEIFHMSIRQIQRHLTKFNGKPFSERLNELRIQNAKELLRNTNLSVASIAREVGYSQTSHFNHVFKSLEKTTPLQYRKSL